MKTVKRVGAAFVLTCVLAMTAFAGDVLTPPCAPPAPGDVLTPPCAAAPGDSGTPTEASTAPGQIETPLANTDTSFAEIAVNALQSMLSLF
jgi:hypothetical protein